MMLGLVTKKYLSLLMNDTNKRFHGALAGLEHTLNTTKDSLLRHQKIYAKSNQGKFDAMDRRISVLEQLFAEEIKKFNESVEKRDREAALAAHDRINGQS